MAKLILDNSEENLLNPKNNQSLHNSFLKKQEDLKDPKELLAMIERGKETVDFLGIPTPNLQLNISGVIQALHVESNQELFAEFELKVGQNWKIKDKSRSQGTTCCSTGNIKSPLVFACPFQAFCYTSTPYGWPKILVTFYGFDLLGNRVTQGYCLVLVPSEPSKRKTRSGAFRPSLGVVQRVLNSLTGKSVDYRQNEKMLLKGEGRENCKIQKFGQLQVSFEINSRNFQRLGYR